MKNRKEKKENGRERRNERRRERVNKRACCLLSYYCYPYYDVDNFTLNQRNQSPRKPRMDEYME